MLPNLTQAFLDSAIYQSGTERDTMKMVATFDIVDGKEESNLE